MKKISDDGMQIYNKYVLRKRISIIITIIILVIVAIFSMGIGSMKIPFDEVVKVLFGNGDPKYTTAILNIRLIRVVTAIIVGAALSVSGAVMQCVLRNPLASASSLGVSQCAAWSGYGHSSIWWRNGSILQVQNLP